MTVLEAKRIAVSFGGVKALQGVDLRVDAGEVVGIIGANGARKTTLFDCLSGITDGEGTVLLDEADVSQSAVHAGPRRARPVLPGRVTVPLDDLLDTLRIGSERHRPTGSSLLGTLFGGKAAPDGEQVATAARRSWTRSSGSGATGTSWSVSSRQGPGGSSTSPACSSSDPRWCCSTAGGNARIFGPFRWDDGLDNGIQDGVDYYCKTAPSRDSYAGTLYGLPYADDLVGKDDPALREQIRGDVLVLAGRLVKYGFSFPRPHGNVSRGPRPRRPPSR